jgi:hypothetical protein
VYLVACFGLAFSNDFVSLMIFRAVQAAGSAATISVGMLPRTLVAHVADLC